MKKKILFKGTIPLLILIVLLLCGVAIIPRLAGIAYAQNNSSSQDVFDLLRKLKSERQPGVEQGQGPAEAPRFSITADGYLSHLGTPPSTYFPVTEVVPGNPEATARNFLKEYGQLFGILSKKTDFRVMRSRKKEGRHYVRFEQTYSGLPVFAAQVIVQLNEAGGVQYVLSDIARDVRVLNEGVISIFPSIPADLAVKKALELFAWANPHADLKTTTPELSIFDPSVVGSPGGLHLVWEMKLYNLRGTYPNEQILMDAHTGEIVADYPLNRYAIEREIYDANNQWDDDGTLVRSEGDPAVWDPPDVNWAYDRIGDAYNFYLDRHNRHGIDDSDMVIEATVRMCSTEENICGCPSNCTCPCTNSFWDGNVEVLGVVIWPGSLYFGEGETVDDVVGHEYTHGVTDFESDLIYKNQSGAINESFSDSWGEWIDLTNTWGNDTDAVRWLLFEDTPQGAARSMKNPPAFSTYAGAMPDRLNSPNYYNGDADHGGVHHNSGVGNKLVYLLTDGDTFNGQSIWGMGIDRVADLYYEVQTNLLSSGADYYDLHVALTQAAVNLGWNVEERNNLYSACSAVEIIRPPWYVDQNNSDCGDWGNCSESRPCCTVTYAVNSAQPGYSLYIKAGTYPETLTISKNLKLYSWGGVVTIGK